MKWRLVKILLLFSILCFYYVSSVIASDDTEYWNTETFGMKIDERLKLKLIEQFRLKYNMGNFYTYVQYAGINYKITDYFDTALWYKLVSSKKNQHWSESHRFDIDGALKLNIDDFKLSNRSRFERNTTKSSWLYRDRIKIEKRVRLFNRDFKPFVSDELFLDLDPHSGFHENRASGGFSVDFIWGSTLSIYYMCRAKKSKGEWTSANIIGTTVGFSF